MTPKRLSLRAFRPRPTARPRTVGRPVERLEDRTVPASWSTFAGDPQHSGLSTVPSQPADFIHWQTPTDLNPTGAFIHYGSPVFTPANTVVYPVKTGAGDGFEVAARNGATGNLLWTLGSDYTQPPHGWILPFGPSLTPSNKLYFPGRGGTVYYVTNPDSPGAAVGGQVAFFGTANYLANPAGYNGSVFVDTPITADAAGNVYFGFMVTGANPSGLTGGGVARIDANGVGSYVLASTAADNTVSRVPLASAPALSADGKTLYAALNNTGQLGGYLVALDSTTLATKSKVSLRDPRNNSATYLIDDSTATPMVAPDGSVFMGTFGNPYNGSRGFMLHFSADLKTQYLPGAFGWDDTPSVVPASAVPGYHGTSSYLIFIKYNNYAGGGDGVNQIALLDPYAAQPDTRNDGAPNLQVMKEVLVQNGPTPDDEFVANFPNAVREWCINSTAIDPFTKAALVNSEDGNLYRWDFTTNTLTQAVNITPGIGEPYTPTSIGPDGTIYAINGGSLSAIGGFAAFALTAVSSRNPAAVGQPVTITTTLAPTAGGPVPTGSVTFTDGATVLASNVPLVNGQASLPTSFSTAGSHFITVDYSGDGTYPSGSTTLVESVRTYTTSVALSAGNLVVTDTTLAGKDDDLTVRADVANGRYVITDPLSAFTIAGTVPGATVSADTHTVFVPFAAVTGTSVTVNTLTGNDRLTVDDSLGSFAAPGKTIVYDGGTQTNAPGDTLRLTGGAVGTATFNYTSAHDGSVLLDAQVIAYADLEPIDATGLTVGSLVFDLPAGPGGAVLEDDGAAGNGASRLRSATGAFEQTTFADPTGSLAVNRGSASDALTIAALPDFTAGLTVGAAGSEFGSVTVTGVVALAPGMDFTAFGTTIAVAAGSGVSTSGGGAVALTATRNIVVGGTLGGGSRGVVLSANQQATPTAGNFVGIDVSGGTVQSAAGVLLEGRGGDAGSDNYGVRVGGSLIASSGGAIGVTASGDGVSMTDATLAAGPGDVTLTADAVALTGSTTIAGTGTLSIRPLDAATTIGLGGGAGTLNLSDAELADLADGFAAILIGLPGGTGAVTVDTALFGDPVVFVGSGRVSDASDAGADVTAGGLTVGGPVAPGGGSHGVFSVAGGLAFTADASLTLQLDGPAPGTGYDRLAVTGPVALGGATLTLAVTFAPAIGSGFVLIDNDGADPVAGTFAGLPEGTQLMFGGRAYQLTYAGGDGNDVALTRVDIPPVAVPDVTAAAEDSPTAFDPRGNDSDADGDPLTITAVTQGSNGGAVAVTGGGTGVTYQPAPNFFGTDSFTCTVSDGHGGTATATVTVTVAEVNDPPVANPDGPYAVAEDPAAPLDVPAAAGLLANDTDPDNTDGFPGNDDVLTAVPGTFATAHGGTVTVAADGSFAYTPAANFNGTDTFTYTLSDGTAAAVGTATLTVTAVNDPPTAAADAATVAEDAAASAIDVLANDTALPDAGETLSVVAVTQGSHGGTVIVTGGGAGLTYQPAANFNGTETFTYTISDGRGGTAVTTVTVTVTPVNDPPTAADDTATVSEDSGPTAIDVLANDSVAPDAGETLRITAVTRPGHGSAAIAGGGAVVTYRPDADFNGTDAFTYTVSDGTSAVTRTVTVVVTPVNDPPTANDDAFTAATERPTVLPVLANDTTAPDAGETLTVASVTQPAAGGAVAITPAGVTFTPAAGFVGTTSFTYTVSDGHGGTDAAVVTLTVRPAAVPFLVGGATDGSVRVLSASGDAFDLGAAFAALPGLGVSARTAVADVTGDGVPDFVVGAGPGSVPRVAVIDGKTSATLVTFSAFEDSFTGGVFVAADDVDGDGKAEVVVTPDESGGPVVAVYRGALLAAGVGGPAAQLTRFFGIAGDPNFRGGCRPALGDVNGDGAADLVVSAGVLGGPRIAVFDGRSLAAGSGDPGRLVGDFFAFEDTLRNGAFVAAGDVTGDGRADLAFGGGPGGAPRVRLFDGAALLAAPAFSNVDAAGAAQRANFFAGDVNLRGGVRPALHDVDGDGTADLAAGSGAGEPSRVRVYKAATLLAGAAAPDLDIDPFGAALANGVFVG